LNGLDARLRQAREKKGGSLLDSNEQQGKAGALHAQSEAASLLLRLWVQRTSCRERERVGVCLNVKK